MIINDKMIFIHLQKCGGTFIKHMMEDHMKAVNVRPEHNGFRDINVSNMKKLIMGSIRNPYSWYVSLYFNHYQNKRSFFIDTFSDKPDFATWVKRFVKINNKRYHDLDFKKIQYWDIGPYSYRMIKCYALSDPNKQNISAKDIKLGNILFIKTNDLANNFVNAVEKNIGIDNEVKKKILNAPRIHTSNHGHYRDYYDRESYDLINHKDRLIFELFNYDYE